MAAGVDWKRHPLYGQGKGKVTDVQTICRILNIAQVDTVLQTVLVKISLNLYWLDERLAERERDQPGLPLPDDLWGPWPELANAVGDGFSVQLLAKGFHDRELGQMNQIIVWEGKINNPMNLLDFPFDLDFVDCIFVNERACLGNSTFVGQMNTYRLVEMKPTSEFLLKAPIEGFCAAGVPPPFMTVYQWDGSIPEWALTGYRVRGATFPVPKGGNKEAWVLALLIERKSEYYFWKAVLPLSLVMFFSCGVNIFPVEDLANRMSMATTMFLAAFATLYVVGNELPKTHFLTSIDKVVTATLLFLSMMAANSWICYALYEKGEEELAVAVNKVVLISFPCLYVLIVMLSFLPAIERKRKALGNVLPEVPPPPGPETPIENPLTREAKLDDKAMSANQLKKSNAEILSELAVISFDSKSVLWTGSLTSTTGYEQVRGKTWTLLVGLAGIPNVPDSEFFGMAGRAGAYLWLAAKVILLMMMVLMCMLYVPAHVRQNAWFAPMMGVVACALPSSGMPVAGGIVFVPTLTLLAGMEPRDAVAFTAATQMIGVGILAPLNWLFHDRRVFVRNGSGDVLFVVMAPSWLGIALTRVFKFSDRFILISFTLFIGIVAFYTFYAVLALGLGSPPKPKGQSRQRLDPAASATTLPSNLDLDEMAEPVVGELDVDEAEAPPATQGHAMKFSAGTICSLVVLGIIGGILVGVIGIGIEKLLFVYLTMVHKVGTKDAGITSIISVGIASSFSFLLFALEGRVPYGFWMMGLPGILIGSTIGPFINQVLGARRLLLLFATMCLAELVHNVLAFTGVINDRFAL